ncbi:DNA-binding protein [Methylocystis echinoides]|uniref:DNA-binding protein n=1 Tax=Methylocystis echinoides TaxID=29468 RepID=UPI003448D778
MTKTPKEKKQSDAFVDAARAIGCDESEERFDEALKKVAKHKPPKDSEEGAAKSQPTQSKDDR